MGRIHKYLNKVHVYQSRQVVRGKRQAWSRSSAERLCIIVRPLFVEPGIGTACANDDLTYHFSFVLINS